MISPDSFPCALSSHSFRIPNRSPRQILCILTPFFVKRGYLYTGDPDAHRLQVLTEGEDNWCAWCHMGLYSDRADKAKERPIEEDALPHSALRWQKQILVLRITEVRSGRHRGSRRVLCAVSKSRFHQSNKFLSLRQKQEPNAARGRSVDQPMDMSHHPEKRHECW